MAIVRVLQVFTIMDIGGAECMIMNYYRKIDHTKIQFDFLVHRQSEGDFDKEIESLGGVIHRLNPINPIFPKRYYTALRNFFEINNSYQIIHSHLNTFSCFPLKIAKEFKIPCRIAHAHIAIDKLSLFSIISQKENLKETAKKIIKLRLKKKVARHANHYFTCGKKAGEWLFGKQFPLTLMTNAIDAKSFRFDENVSLKYKSIENLKGKTVIGHVGRLDIQKNHSYLLQILRELGEQNTQFHLVIVGEGPLKKKLMLECESLKISERVHFFGLRTDVSQLYQMFDFFVFPSFYEGLPLTLIEAQAAGLMVLASDTITKETKLTDNVNFLSITNPPSTWANKILEIGNYKRRDTTNEIIVGKYDIISNAHEIANFYLKVISG